MVTNTEGGLRNHRLEFVRESSTGTPPSNPSWNLFSDTVRNFEWEPDTDIEEQRGIGDADPNTFYKGAETHDITVEYDLQQWFSSTGDAAYDGMARDADNLPTSTHTIVDREDKASISAGQTVNGSTSRDTRIYTVAKGGYIDEVTLSGDPGSQNPVSVELTYQFEKGRTYQVDQPSSSTTLAIQSTNSNDTSQTLTVEDEGASTTEDVSLNGKSLVSTSSSFSDIDALELDAETQGDVEVYVNTGSSSTPSKGDKLAVIYGSASYEDTVGDVGIPALGTGSHASAIGSSYEIIVGDTIERPSGTALAYDINSVELTVSNNLETSERVDDVTMRIDAGGRDTELDATIVGESESHQKILEHLQVTENNVKWTMTGGNLQVDNAALTDAGSRTIEAGDAAMTLDNTFTGKGLTIN